MRRRDDRPFLADLPPAAQPVFLIGLHRSGTTLLYQMIADVLPVTVLTAHDVLNYERILRFHHERRTAGARAELDALFREWGCATRGLDEIPLSSSMPEEYGWILRRRRGSFRARPWTAPVLEEICRKLQFLGGAVEAVVLKNPWDTGRVGAILARFPGARFVFLRRDPVAIVNSQFRVAKEFGERTNPYVRLLFKGIPFGRSWLAFQRLARMAVGERRHGRLALGHILRSVSRELGRLESSWNAVPDRQRLALSYEGLVRDPKRSMDRIAVFLGIDPRRAAVVEAPRPRLGGLLPQVAVIEASFRRRLKKMGVAQQPLDAAPAPRAEARSSVRRP